MNMRKIIFVVIIFLSLIACQNNHIDKIENKNSQADEVINNLKNKAETAFKDKNYKDAELHYKELISLKSDINQSTFFLAESYRLQNKFTQAIELYSKIDPYQSPEIYLAAVEGEALTNIQMGNVDKAISLLHKIIQTDATRWRTINALGVAYSLKGDINNSEAYFNAALELNKNSAFIQNNAGLSLIIADKASVGIKFLEQAYKQTDKESPSYKRITNNLAMGYVFTGNNKKAESILMSNMSKSAAYNNLGYFAILKDERNMAKEYLRKALNSSPVYYELAGNNLQMLDK